MNLHHVLFFCFSSAALLDGNTGFAETRTKLEGEDFNNPFDLEVPKGSRIYLCRNNCTKEDVLIQTHGIRFRSDRYSIRYDSDSKKVYAAIIGLKQSDTGLYKVGVSNSSSLGSYKEIEIKVRARCEEVSGEPRIYSATEGENITITCFLFLQPRNRKFLCREKCNKFLFDTNDQRASSERFEIKYRNTSGFDVTFTQLTKSDSGRYMCGVGRQDAINTCHLFEITVAGGDVLLLAVCLTVVIVLMAICVGLLFLYKWKRRNADDENTMMNGRNTEIPTYENFAAVSAHEGSVYQDLDLGSRDQNVYYSLRK